MISFKEFSIRQEAGVRASFLEMVTLVMESYFKFFVEKKKKEFEIWSRIKLLYMFVHFIHILAQDLFPHMPY